MAEEYIITLVNAQITRPSNLPPTKSNGVFCKVKYSHQEYKTKVINNALNPEFKDTFRLKKVKKDDSLIIELWDWETAIKSEIICSGIFDLKGLKFKKNTPSQKDLTVKSGKIEKKVATIFFEIEYTREGIESEQEKEHKLIEEKPKEEEKVEEPEPLKKKREPLPMFELPKKERKKPNIIQKKLLGESYSKAVNELEEFNLGFEKWDFSLDEKARIAIMEALHELGRLRPKNPITFLGEFLKNYQGKN